MNWNWPEPRSVSVARPRFDQVLGGAAKSGLASTLQFVLLKASKRTVFVPVEEIDFVESVGNYAILHVAAETMFCARTLSNLEAKLPTHRFLRVSRSVIVNLTFIDRAQQASRRDRVLLLKNGKEIPVTWSLREIRRRIESL